MKRLILTLALAAIALAQAPADQRQVAEFRKGISIGNLGSGGTLLRQVRTGTATFVAGVATVADARVTAATQIFAQRMAVAGTSGVGIAVVVTPGTGFTLTSQTAGALTTQTADTSTVAWAAIQP
jgi:hypothetical protein